MNALGWAIVAQCPSSQKKNALMKQKAQLAGPLINFLFFFLPPETLRLIASLHESQWRWRTSPQNHILRAQKDLI
jgi:hypothetical protein